jgi:site-specific DNA recombinase
MASLTLNGLRVGIYVRISDDSAGEGKGVARQETDARAHTASHGGTVARVYVENDTSAYKKSRLRRTDDHGRPYFVYRVIRPVFAELLADLRSDALDAAVVYDADRLARDPRDLEDLLDVVAHGHKRIESCTGGLDLMTEGGIMTARVMTAVANQSSQATSRRVARVHAEKAQEGKPVGGTRAFGWLADKVTVEPTEAAAIRDGYSRLMGGAGLAEVTRLWNDQGLPTPPGNQWRPQSVKQVYMNPRLAGMRARQVKVTHPVTGALSMPWELVRDSSSQPVQGTWPGILTVPEWEAVTAVIANRSAGFTNATNASVYLLSGIARCGKCSAPMRGVPVRKKDGRTVGGPGSFTYACPPPAQGGCSGVGRSGLKVDAQVTEALFIAAEDELANNDTQALPVAFEGDQRLADIDARLEELKTAWINGVVAGDLYFPLQRELADERAELLRKRGQSLAEAARRTLLNGDLRPLWDGYTLNQKRAVIKSFFEAVVIRPAAQRGAIPYDPTLIEIVRK